MSFGRFIPLCLLLHTIVTPRELHTFLQSRATEWELLIECEYCLLRIRIEYFQEDLKDQKDQGRIIKSS